MDFERGLSSEDLAERREDNPDKRKAESKGMESKLPRKLLGSSEKQNEKKYLGRKQKEILERGAWARTWIVSNKAKVPFFWEGGNF